MVLWDMSPPSSWSAGFPCPNSLSLDLLACCGVSSTSLDLVTQTLEEDGDGSGAGSLVERTPCLLQNAICPGSPVIWLLSDDMIPFLHCVKHPSWVMIPPINGFWEIKHSFSFRRGWGLLIQTSANTLFRNKSLCSPSNNCSFVLQGNSCFP